MVQPPHDLPIDEVDNTQDMTRASVGTLLSHPPDSHGTRGTDVHPLALYVDGVRHTKRDGVIGFFIYSLVTPRRHLCVAVRKSDLCRCGCRGWCSMRGAQRRR